MTLGSIELQYPLNTDGWEIQPHFDLLPNSPLYHASLESATYGALFAPNTGHRPGPSSIADWFILDPHVRDTTSEENAQDTDLEIPQAQLRHVAAATMGLNALATSSALSHAEQHQISTMFPRFNRAPSKREGVALSKQRPYSRETVKTKTEESDVSYFELDSSTGSNRPQDEIKQGPTSALFTQSSDPTPVPSLPDSFKSRGTFSTNTTEYSAGPFWPGSPLLFASRLSPPLDFDSEAAPINSANTAGLTPTALYPIKPEDSPPPKISTSSIVIAGPIPPIVPKPAHLPQIVIPVLPTADESTNQTLKPTVSAKKSRKVIVRAKDGRVRQSARLCCSKGYTGPNGDREQHKASTRVKLLECNLNGALDDSELFEKVLNAHIGCNLSAITKATSYYGMDLALWKYLIERASDPNDHRVTKIGIQTEAKRLWDDYLIKYPMFKDGKETSHFSSTWIKNFLPRHGIDVCHQKIRISRVSASTPWPEKLNPAWYNYLAKNHPELLDQ